MGDMTNQGDDQDAEKHVASSQKLGFVLHEFLFVVLSDFEGLSKLYFWLIFVSVHAERERFSNHSRQVLRSARTRLPLVRLNVPVAVTPGS